MRISCRKVRRLLSAYRDEQLPLARSQRVATHLTACATCREELEAHRFTSELLAALPTPQLFFDLAPSVVARADASTCGRLWRRLDLLLVARRSFVARQFIRAVTFAAFLLLAALGPKVNTNIILSWPARVGRVAERGTTYLSAALTEVGELMQKKSTHNDSSSDTPRNKQYEKTRPLEDQQERGVGARGWYDPALVKISGGKHYV